MIRMLSVMLAAICLFGSPALAGDSIKDRCSRITDNNAEYGNCINRLSERESKDLVYKLCNGESCIFRLACDSEAVCVGSGFRVTYETAPAGNDITIRDPRKRVTKMFQCGTCKWLDYESGPLKDADIKMSGKSSIILEVPRSQL